MSEYLYKPYMENCFILEERTGESAQQFTGSKKTSEVKLCVKYPTKRGDFWYFFVEVVDEGSPLERYELDLSNAEEVKAHIRKLNPTNFCEEPDLTDYANWICR